jgi:hypothetical protein
MAFVPNKKIGLNLLKKAVIANSQAITIGDAIQPAATSHNQYVTPATTSGLILGVVVGIEKVNGTVPNELSTVTVGSGNETTQVYQALYIPSYLPMEYVVDLSAVPTGDNLAMCFLALATAATADAASSSNLFGGTANQLWSYGVTSYSTSKANVHIYKSL